MYLRIINTKVEHFKTKQESHFDILFHDFQIDKKLRTANKHLNWKCPSIHSVTGIKPIESTGYKFSNKFRLTIKREEY